MGIVCKNQRKRAARKKVIRKKPRGGVESKAAAKSQHSDGDTEVNNATLAVTEQPEPSEKHNLTQKIESEMKETGNSSSFSQQ